MIPSCGYHQQLLYMIYIYKTKLMKISSKTKLTDHEKWAKATKYFPEPGIVGFFVCVCLPGTFSPRKLA